MVAGRIHSDQALEDLVNSLFECNHVIHFGGSVVKKPAISGRLFSFFLLSCRAGSDLAQGRSPSVIRGVLG